MGAILNMTEWSQLIPGHGNPCNWITWITGQESLSMVSQRVGHDWVTEKQHLLMAMCSVVSCVVGRGYLLWPVRSLGKTLLAFALLHYVLQGQICLLFQVSLDFLLLHSSPLYQKGHLFLVLVLEGLVGLIAPFNFSLFGICGWGIELDYYDIGSLELLGLQC